MFQRHHFFAAFFSKIIVTLFIILHSIISIMMQNQQFLKAKHYVKPSVTSVYKFTICKQNSTVQ